MNRRVQDWRSRPACGPGARCLRAARSAGLTGALAFCGILLFGLLQGVSTMVIAGWLAVIASFHR